MAPRSSETKAPSPSREFRALPPADYPNLSSYGLVGDGVSAALVSALGSVDWWCPARFDRPSVFARLLDRDVGGHFVVALPVRHRNEVRYLEDTNILCSRFTTSDAAVSLRTFMPHVQGQGDQGAPGRIVRQLECHRGAVDVTVELAPAFDYGRSPPRLARDREDGSLIASCSKQREGEAGVQGPSDGSECDTHASAEAEQPGRQGAGGSEDGSFGSLRLSSTVDLEIAREAKAATGGPRGAARGTLRLEEGDEHALILDHRADAVPETVDDPLGQAQAAFQATKDFWRSWTEGCTYQGPHRDAVVRSLLALKLLQHAPTGSFVAAPTTSLPERPGGGRNWDYRFAWLRDGYHTVMALDSAGYEREAQRFKQWLAGILRRDAPDDVQMLYRVDGGRDLEEAELDHLEGYRRSSPVRIGNEAAKQRQLDTFGELTACLHRAPEVFEAETAEETWRALRGLVEWVGEHWQEPDSGLWELRGDLHHYVYGKAMAWVALDHGIAIAETYGFEAPTHEWREERKRVRAFLLDNGFDESFGAFTQTTDRSDADAANLLLPTLGFLDAEDPRMQATVDRTIEDLLSHGLCHRYIVDDRLRGNEGAFLVASFWLAELLAAQDRTREAVEVFDRARSTAGPLGLLAEEADPVSGELVGNYPQGLSHLGLVLAAIRLEGA